MKCKVLLSFFAMLVVLVTFSTNVLASENLNKEFDFDSLKEQLLQEIKKEYPNATFIDPTDEEYEDLQKKQKQKNNKSNDSIGTMSSAPPLSYLEVYAAISSNYPTYEYFAQNQFSSVNDHGGTQMYIVTVELGYGRQGIAKINGATLPLYQSQYIDLNGDSIIDGWYKWWDASGYQSGTFSYQNTSINFPGNTMSDSIYIK